MVKAAKNLVRMSWCAALAIVLSSGVARAERPEPCEEGLQNEMQDFIKMYDDRDKNCTALKDELCSMIQYRMPGAAANQTVDISLCTLTYDLMARAAREYIGIMANHCANVKRKYEACALKANDREKFLCIKDAANTAMTPEERSAMHLNAERTRVAQLALSDRLKQLREQYEKDKKFFFNPRRAGSPPPNIDDEVACGKNPRNERIPPDRYKANLTSGPSSIFSQLNLIEGASKHFIEVSERAEKAHRGRVTGYRSQQRKMDELVRGIRTAGTPPDTKKQPDNPSDITGTQRPQQQAGGPPPGGGGPPGGGSGGGSGGGPSGGGTPSGLDSLASNGATPSNLNNSSTPKESTSNKPIKVATNTPGSGSATAEAMNPTVPASNVNSGSGTGLGLGLTGSASRGLASTGKGSGSTAASSSASGGGGLGGGGGGGGSSVPCLGKDCQQALSATGGQFAAAGGLGGGGGFGAEDTSSALDNLFKSDDENKAGTGPDGDPLAGFDAEPGAGEGGDLGGDLQASGAGGEIGGVDGGDLFERVRGMHTRAQKKGLVAGIMKKL